MRFREIREIKNERDEILRKEEEERKKRFVEIKPQTNITVTEARSFITTLFY